MTEWITQLFASSLAGGLCVGAAVAIFNAWRV